MSSQSSYFETDTERSKWSERMSMSEQDTFFKLTDSNIVQYGELGGTVAVTQTDPEDDVAQLRLQLEQYKQVSYRLEKTNGELRTEINSNVNDMVKLNKKYLSTKRDLQKFKFLSEEQSSELRQIYKFTEELIGPDENDNPRSFKQIVSRLEIIGLRYKRSQVKWSQLNENKKSLEKEVQQSRQKIKAMTTETIGQKVRTTDVSLKAQKKVSSQLRQKIGRKKALFNYKKSQTDNLGDELKTILASRTGTISISPDAISDQGINQSKDYFKTLATKYELDDVVPESDEEMYKTKTEEYFPVEQKPKRPASATGVVKASSHGRKPRKNSIRRGSKRSPPGFI